MKPSIGFIGVGLMGKGMAANLLKAGYSVTVSPHRNMEPVRELEGKGAKVGGTPKDIAAESDVIISIVPDAPQVEEVCLGPNGIRHTARAGTILIDMSTIAPTATIRVGAVLAETGVRMLDAPVSGGPEGATAGTLTIMVGGDATTFEECRPILEAMGRPTLVGDLGMGELVKVCNNTILGVIQLVNAEALALGAKLGVDPEIMRKVILTSSGANNNLDMRAPRTIFKNEYVPGFFLDFLAKDMAAFVSTARDSAMGTPVAALSLQIYEMARGLGYGREDFSAVSKIYQDAANVTIADRKPRR
ncbi:MAG: NAD(P)-dependent oxidoreductase [Chloroflexi bacterium]|nr:NAD(P)-dependent oxidoreductase [Chloroflexota bacterium]